MKTLNQKKEIGDYASTIPKDGQVIGMGTGSTISYFAKAIKNRIDTGEEFFAVPTSYQSLLLCQENGIKITSLNEHRPELAFDGADEVNNDKCLIKGRGGAMTQEKIVDYYSKEFYVLVDGTKIVEKLGTNFPVPIEIIPMALKPVMESLKEYGRPILRVAEKKDGPIITDNGNFIVDLNMKINDPYLIEQKLNNIPGVIENGIFTRPCKIIMMHDDIIDVK